MDHGTTMARTPVPVVAGRRVVVIARDLARGLDQLIGDSGIDVRVRIVKGITTSTRSDGNRVTGDSRIGKAVISAVRLDRGVVNPVRSAASAVSAPMVAVV